MDIAQSIGLSVVEERQADGNPLLEDGEQILESFEDIQLILASDADQGLGKVFITEECVFSFNRAFIHVLYDGYFPPNTSRNI